MNEEKPVDKDKLHERLVRWQQITREQLSYAINMFLGFAGATIGFEISLLSGHHLELTTCWQKDAYFGSVVFLALSFVPGISAAITRLCDFRLTTRKLRIEWEDSERKAEIPKLKKCTQKLGKCTWNLFFLQATFFSLGIVLVAVVFAFYAFQIFDTL